MQGINLSPLTAEQAALDRRRRMAEAMQQQSISPIEMPNVPGVRISPYQGLAKLLQGYLAGKKLEKADTEQKELEANTMADFAKIYGLAGRTETVPGKEITPAVPSVAIPENMARQAELARLNQPEAGFENQAAIGRTLMRPQDVQQIQNLPTSTAAVPAVMSPDQQVPMLKADMLNDPKFTQTSAGRMMLAQALMQQQTQQQAAAQRSREIKSRNPEEDLYRVVDGKVEILSAGKPKATLPKWEKSSIYENGKEVTGWVNTNAPDIPASFVKGAVKPEMTKAQQLELAIKLFGTRVDAQKAIDEGRVPLTFDPAELDIKPLPPQGTALQIGVVYDTPKGRFRWNGAKFISVD
jgi:hypothetical protein